MGIRSRPERKVTKDARREKITRELQAVTGGVLKESARPRGLDERRLCSLWKGEVDGCTPTDFALNRGRAPMKGDNRLY